MYYENTNDDTIELLNDRIKYFYTEENKVELKNQYNKKLTLLQHKNGIIKTLCLNIYYITKKYDFKCDYIIKYCIDNSYPIKVQTLIEKYLEDIEFYKNTFISTIEEYDEFINSDLNYNDFVLLKVNKKLKELNFSDVFIKIYQDKIRNRFDINRIEALVKECDSKYMMMYLILKEK